MLDLGRTLRHAARSGLTADGKQKISLGRGLVRADVNAILFDEPLTVIDPHLKWLLRSQAQAAAPAASAARMIYVTHDQTEALTFADQVVVMYDGEVVQIGTPAELFERPAHTFVGHFIGSPGMNVLPCEIDGDRRVAARRRCRCRGAPTAQPPAARPRLGIRPEFVRLGRRGHCRSSSRAQVEDIGRYSIVRAELDGQAINALAADEDATIPAETRRVSLRSGAASTSTPTAGGVEGGAA